MECCNTYRPWHDKTTGKTFLNFDLSKCLHYYFYFIDKEFGCVLRIESTCNDISTFRMKREVQHKDGTANVQKAPLKKSIYSLYHLFAILKSANLRYLEFISSFDDHSSGKKKLDEVSRLQ